MTKRHPHPGPLPRGREGRIWTVARLAALLGRLKKRLTFAELKSRYGLDIEGLYLLNSKLLGTVEETGSQGAVPLSIQLDTGVAFSVTGPLLEKAASISKAELYLALSGLRWIVVGPGFLRAILDLAKTLESGAAPLDDGRREAFFGHFFTGREAAVLLTFVEARQEGRKLHFRYNKDEPGYYRVVRPLSLRKDAGEWRLLAWDEGRKGLRVFKLVHVSDAEVLSDAFEWPGGVDREEAQSRDLSVYRPSGREDEVKLKIRAEALRRLQHLFPPNRAPKTGNAWSMVELLSTDPQWVARTLLPEFPNVRVVSPPEYKKAMKDEYLAVCAIYR